LYVEDRSAAKLAKAVALEIGRVFGRQELIDAVKICYDRSPEFVTEYLEENFQLRPGSEKAPKEADNTANGRVQENQPADEPSETRPGWEDKGKIADSVQEGGMFDGAPALADGNGEKDGASIMDDEDDGRSEPGKPRRPSKPSVMERFAIMNGYRKEGPDRFSRTDGSSLVHVTGDSFHWERRDAAGDSVQYYWAKEHCLERAPLQIDAVVWELCKKQPDLYSLILTDSDDNPFQVTGRRLIGMCDAGDLRLYPAAYRLVREQENSR
jgi:hypothetical protein